MGAASRTGARPFSITGRVYRVETAAPTRTASPVNTAATKAPIPSASATSLWKLATALVTEIAAMAMSFVCAFIG